jgi:ribosomal protein L18
MSVKFTGQHIYVQFVDDVVGKTLVAVGTRDKAAPTEVKGANSSNAILTGKRAAAAAKDKDA